MALSFLMASTFSHASLALPLKTLLVPCFKEKQNALIHSQPRDTTIHCLSSHLFISLYGFYKKSHWWSGRFVRLSHGWWIYVALE